MNQGASDLLFQGYLPTVQGLIYTIPDSFNNGRVEVRALWICNTGGIIVPTTLLFGRGVLGKANALFWNAPVEPSRTYIVFGGEPVNLSAGFKFEGLAGTANAVVLTIFGQVYQG